MTTLNKKETIKFLKQMKKTDKSPISKKDKKLAEEIKKNMKNFKVKEFDEEKATEEMEKLTKSLFKKMDKLVEKEWGKECPVYHYKCMLCRIYDVYNRFKKDLELEYLRKNE